MPNILTDEEQQWVHFAPSELINRQFSEWQGLRADVVTAVRQNPFEYTFSSPQHLLIAAEQSERDDGETLVEGLPRSTLRNLSGRLTVVPAGHKFYGWQNPRVLTRVNYFYIDPRGAAARQPVAVCRDRFSAAPVLFRSRDRRPSAPTDRVRTTPKHSVFCWRTNWCGGTAAACPSLRAAG